MLHSFRIYAIMAPHNFLGLVTLSNACLCHYPTRCFLVSLLFSMCPVNPRILVSINILGKEMNPYFPVLCPVTSHHDRKSLYWHTIRWLQDKNKQFFYYDMSYRNTRGLNKNVYHYCQACYAQIIF